MPGAVLGAAVAVLLLTAALGLVALVVSAAGARRARRAVVLRDALVAGEVLSPSLRDLGRLVEDLSATWRAADLRRLLPPEAEQQLRVQSLRDLRAPRWRARLAAARLLTALGPREPLVRLLDDPVDVVRAVACGAVGPGSDAAALDAVARLLDDPEPGVRYAAADGLARCGPHAGRALARLLERTPPPAVRAAALSLAVPGADALLPHADAAAGATQPEVRCAAAGALAALGDPAGRLPSLIADREPLVAAAACRAAGGLREPRLARPLAAALRSSSWEVRTSAAAALAGLGPAGALLLRTAVDGPDAYARDAALSVLGLAAAPVPA